MYNLPLILSILVIFQEIGCTDSTIITQVPTLDAGISSENDEGEQHQTGMDASDYCELLAEPWCEMYLRCDWIEADTMTQCKEIVMTSCEGRYEPYWSALEGIELLAFKSERIEACAEFLKASECEEIDSELEGPCRILFQGLQEKNATCGLGIDNFICAETERCVVDTSFCGSCESISQNGESCQNNNSCLYTSFCNTEKVCEARVRRGRSCEEKSCLLGVRCVEGICASKSFAELDGACDRTQECKYGATCINGACAKDLKQGDVCDGSQACLAGICLGGSCVPLRAEGQSCRAPSDCLSTRCIDGTCDGIPGQCFQ